MVLEVTLDKVESLIRNKFSFIICTYYIDSYSKFYTAMLNKELKKNSIDIYYLNVEDFMKRFNLTKRVFPIFCVFINGELSWKTCGFIEYNELINKISKKMVLFS